MSLVNKLLAVSEETKIQPYFLAYLIEKEGVFNSEVRFPLLEGKTFKPPCNLDYMQWIYARWRETCKTLGISGDRQQFYADKHLEFLAERPFVKAALSKAQA